MGHSRFISILLLSSLLCLTFTYGFGRVLMETADHPHLTAGADEIVGKSRLMIEVMDYADPEPNTNPRSGYIFSPPAPASTPHPQPQG